MNLLKSLKLRFKPPRMTDPDFGPLLFMLIAGHPERSYWEGEWHFPPTGTRVHVALAGGESGPDPRVRRWHLELPDRFPRILAGVRSELGRVFRQWLDRELPQDIWSVLKLSGFGVRDPQTDPVEWEISFETTGSKWLGISIPFRGETAGEAVVDT